MLKLLGAYKNGNYTVKVLSDGTKIRETNDDEFIPAFAENCDVKITDRCDGGCPFCYEGCTPYGRHGDILNYKFLDTLHPYTELAINGNDLSHPDLIPFLEKMKDKYIITNMTVNQIHFERHYDFISELVSKKLIYGLGVSLKEPTEDFITKIKKFPNAVIHCINGILTPNDYEILKDNDLKMLILGYKQLRRGVVYYESNGDEVHELQNWLYDNLEDMLNHFKVVSFDNLAIEQLEVNRLLEEDQWEEFYMGDDGKYTFYIDMVDGTFGKNSLATDRYPIMDSIDEMFQKVLNEGVKL
jgi:hypothetical protein